MDKPSVMRSKWFYRYLLSYIAVLAVPLLVIGLLVYNDFMRTLREEVTASNWSLLSQVKEVIDVRMGELDKIAYQISSNPQLTPYAATKDVYQGMKVIRELKNYAAGNSFIAELVLHMRGFPMLYSSFSSYPLDSFAGESYKFGEWSQEQFERDLDGADVRLRPAETAGIRQGDRIIPYVVPIPYKDEAPYGNVLFMLSEQSIKAVIRHVLADYGGNTFIVDPAGRIVTSLAAESRFDLADLLSRIGAEGNGSIEAELDGETYYATYIRSAHPMAWTYVTLVEKSRVLAPVVRVRKLALAGLGVTLLFGAAVIWMLMRLNYNPLRSLKQFAESLSGRRAAGGAAVHDELEAIRRAVSGISEDSSVLREQLHRSKPAMRAFLISQLIKGHVRDIGDFNKAGKNCGLDFQGGYFRIAVFLFRDSLGGEEAALSREQLLPFIERQLASETECGALDAVEPDRALLLLAASSPEETDVRAALERCRQAIFERWGVQATIGLGRAVRETREIGQSYIEATTALEYRLVQGRNRLISFADVGEAAAGGYSKSELAALEVALKQGNADKIRESVDEVMALVHRSGPSLFMARSICYELIHTVLRPLDELNVGDEPLPLPDALSLFAFETVEELAELVHEVSQSIGKRIKMSKESGNYALKEELLAYIDRHYADYHFSLQTMAEALGMSSSYLSRYFKDQTGYTVSQVLNQVRMNQAKALLRAEDISIAELVSRIGYASTSSFIRKFRECEGLTPGEYRKLVVKDGISES
ncbi:helix-turn-helix domain-containing protein [Paenibacillus oceani]|uniref:Helix-turn-helix domain-containing protein n=1 Tax=Paenibacillus oceani TaxID=2772510 RepID=A0A927CDN3_9BACL|nr:helix-turn-helix domain-containing protein [Paenibacillus oceani]MBD2864321.1 helix-turn-helix domain-containing protein [Paenibacillus oceani]